MSLEIQAALVALAVFCIPIIGASFGLAWWLSAQFTKNRSLFWNGIAELQRTFEIKMDNHERLDMQRFDKVHEVVKEQDARIWKMLVAAARAGNVTDE